MVLLKNKSIEKRLKKLKIIFLDMDGTIYMGNDIFPWTIDFLKGLTAKNIRYVFLTNNSSRSADAYVNKLAKMGIEASIEDIYTSGDATIDYLKEHKVKKIFLMGTPSLEEAFVKAGFKLSDNNPDMIVMGYDKTLTYQKLNTAYHLIKHGVPWCATHPDMLCPTPTGFDIDLGAMMQALISATGVEPKVIGKPNAEMTGPLLNRLGVSSEYVAIMGDRLYTDIKTGLNGGLISILVLTGEATKEDVKTSEVAPHIMIDKNIDLLDFFS